MKKLKKLLLVVLSVVLIGLTRIPVSAQYYVGESVTVYLETSWSTPLAGFYFVEGPLSDSGSVGDPINGNYLTYFSVPVTFTPTSAGDYTVTISFDVSDENSTFTPVPAISQTITVTDRSTPEPEPEPEPEPTLSSNFYLGSLNVEPGTLSPSFDRNTDVYSILLEEGTETYTVGASTEHYAATLLSGTGTFTVYDRQFLHRVVIEAEDGSIFEYHLYFSLPDDRSSNNDLSSLSVTPGRLAPSFSADVTEYTLEVPKGTDSVTVSAMASDDKSSISGNGSHKLTEDEENIVEVIVTAENMSTKVYSITIVEADMVEQTITHNGVDYEFDYDIDAEIEKIGFKLKTDLPSFEEGTPYAENLDGTMKAVYLKQGNSSDWYILEGNNAIGEKIVLVDIDGTIYGYIGIPSEHQKQPQMTLSKVDLNRVEIDGFSYQDDAQKDYLMFYLIDETGNPDFFLYHQPSTTMMKIGDNRLLDPTKVIEQDDELDGSETDDTEENSPENVTNSRSILVLILSILVIGVIASGILLFRYKREKL